VTDASPTAAPLVGAVRVVRTFRVSTDGRLLSTTTAGCTRTEAAIGPYAWLPGDNDARCPRPDHAGPVPGTRCSCGFYGYADIGSLLRSDVPGCHDLMAVVALTGRVIPARRGARGQHARIEAVWMSRRARSRGIVDKISRRYPAAAVYADRDAMFAEFPLSRLPGQRLRHGPSWWLLVLQTLYFLAVWIVPMLLPHSEPPDGVVDTRWGYLALGLGVLGASGVPAIRQLSRGWWVSALPTPLLFATAVLTPGVPGLLVTMALLGASMAGFVWEVGLFIATYCRVGRRLSILELDPHPRPVRPPEVRSDARDAVPRLLLVLSSAMAVGIVAQDLRALVAGLLVGAYLSLATLYAILIEKARRHRIALALLALSVIPPLLSGLSALTAAAIALAAAGILFTLGYVYLTPAERSS
jgi:hypothetical protein